MNIKNIHLKRTWDFATSPFQLLIQSAKGLKYAFNENDNSAKLLYGYTGFASLFAIIAPIVFATGASLLVGSISYIGTCAALNHFSANENLQTLRQREDAEAVISKHTMISHYDH